MNKAKIYFNKPIYLSPKILDILKTLMYDFHYNYILKKYPNNTKLLMTDTDSLMYEIKTKKIFMKIFVVIYQVHLILQIIQMIIF